MPPFVDVSFFPHPHDPSLAAAAHRWVARLEAVGLEVRCATITILPAPRHATSVALDLELTDGARSTGRSVHADAYVAVSSAFRAVRQQLAPDHPMTTHGATLLERAPVRRGARHPG